MRHRRVACLSILVTSLLIVSAVAGVSTGENLEPSLEIDLPEEMVATYDNEVLVNVTGDVEVEVVRVSLQVDGELHAEVESEQPDTSLMYRPENLGGKNLSFHAEATLADDRTVELTEDVEVEPERILMSHVGDGVALPLPSDLEEEILEAAEERGIDTERYSFMWAPVPGDHTMYVVKTERDVEKSNVRYVGSLATSYERRHVELTDDIVLCFYHANYLTFYDGADIDLTREPGDVELDHGDNVVLDLRIQGLEADEATSSESFYLYEGDSYTEPLVFVDHAGVLDGVEEEHLIRGAVVSVAFSEALYLDHYGLPEATYVYPTGVYERDELPVVPEGERILSGEEDARTMSDWPNLARVSPPRGDETTAETPEYGRDVDTDPAQTDDVEEEPQPLPKTVLAFTLLVFLALGKLRRVNSQDVEPSTLRNHR